MWPLGDHLVTTRWSLGDHLLTTWWPLGDHLVTTSILPCPQPVHLLFIHCWVEPSLLCQVHALFTLPYTFALCRTDSWIVSDWIGSELFTLSNTNIVWKCMKVENRSIDESECRQCVHWEKFVKNIVFDSLSLRVDFTWLQQWDRQHCRLSICTASEAETRALSTMGCCGKVVYNYKLWFRNTDKLVIPTPHIKHFWFILSSKTFWRQV